MNKPRFATLIGLTILCGLTGLPFSGSAWADSDDDSEDAITARTEQQVEDSVTSSVEETVSQTVEATVEDSVQQAVEVKVEDSVENSVEKQAQDSVENQVETTVEGGIEATVEDSVQQGVETEVEDSVEREVESSVEDAAESSTQSNLDDSVESRVGDSDSVPSVGDDREPEHEASDTGDDSSSSEPDGQINGGHEDNSGSHAGKDWAAERFAGLGFDNEGNEISVGEWLVIASAAQIETLEKLGYVTRSREPLDGLGRVLAHMEAPESFDIDAAQSAIRKALPDAEIDYNHVYRAESGPARESNGGARPRELFAAAGFDRAPSAPIGMIDTQVDTSHSALHDARIRSRDFVSYDAARPAAHGTAIASILVGKAAAYRGLLPDAELFAASVFFRTPNGSDAATTVSLVRALDWMARNRVTVVNMSLAGPRNDILEAAINRAYQIGTVVVAAVGNRGPGAKPLYPAAYPDVVAVTAVNTDRKIYRLANRGSEVDFSAPGVNVLHADPSGGYETSSGTSMAAPFVTAAIDVSCTRRDALPACLRDLQANAEDLGVAGFDPVYGYGFIVPLNAPDTTVSAASSRNGFIP